MANCGQVQHTEKLIEVMAILVKVCLRRLILVSSVSGVRTKGEEPPYGGTLMSCCWAEAGRSSSCIYSSQLASAQNDLYAEVAYFRVACHYFLRSNQSSAAPVNNSGFQPVFCGASSLRCLYFSKKVLWTSQFEKCSVK